MSSKLDVKTPIAVRSLQCVDHAVNIPPRVLSVTWFLGKRCNYDCSYCSPHIHDAVSPFVDINSALQFVDAMHQHSRLHDRRVKWSFTGGEPFIDPNMMELARYLRQCDLLEQLNVTTNGSLSLSTYKIAAELFDGITFSLHLERSLDEINDTVQKISQLESCTISVNLMALPGHFDTVKALVALFNQKNISYVVRKILPPVQDTALEPFYHNTHSRKSRVLDDVPTQRQKKIEWKKKNASQSSFGEHNFYSDEELSYLATMNRDTAWNNCGVWFDDNSYQELNTDWLVTNSLNQFRGWTCYAGVDSFYVDFDGSIYRGMCQNGGAIGHIARQFDPATMTSTVCDLSWCSCNSDIAVRKSQTGRSRIDQ